MKILKMYADEEVNRFVCVTVNSIACKGNGKGQLIALKTISVKRERERETIDSLTVRCYCAEGFNCVHR